MKKYLSVFLVFSFLFGAVNFVSAQGAGGYSASGSNTNAGAPLLMSNKTPAEIEAMRLEAKQKMEELKAQAKTLRDKARAQAQERRIIAREIALAKFDRAISKVGTIKTKIESQYPKLESLGVDTSGAKTKLTEVQTKIDKAKSIVAEANQLLASSGGELSAETKEKLKNMAKEAQTLIREAHNTSVDTLKMLREAVRAKRNGPTGTGNSGTNGPDGQVIPAGNSTAVVEEPSFACSYAPAPEGCTYVPGPEYNNQTSCGLVLSCQNPQ